MTVGTWFGALRVRGDPLRKGDLVEVRTPSEILDNLDDQGALEALPFMPEMVAHCRRRFFVDRRAEKVCDTIEYLRRRRLGDCVLVDDVRCDGSGHDGCQAECRVYWKEAWLKRVTPSEPAAGNRDDLDGRRAARARAGRPPTATENGGVRYRCQATEMLAASEPLSLTDPRPYVRECASGNVSIRTFTQGHDPRHG